MARTLLPRTEFIRIHTNIFRVSDISSIELGKTEDGDPTLYVILKIEYGCEIPLEGFTKDEAVELLEELCNLLNEMYTEEEI